MLKLWLKRGAIGFTGLLALAAVGVPITQRVSDGPIAFLQGGSFTSGELAEAPVSDWSFGVGRSIEFELVGFGTSRTAGYIVHDNVPYMTCDLGFMWNRFDGRRRWILNLIYVFKRWHKDAVQDGRAVLRIDGRLYPVNFVKVQDPALNAALREKLEDLARGFVAPDELGPAPEEPPNDVWFFRMDHRA